MAADGHAAITHKKARAAKNSEPTLIDSATLEAAAGLGKW